MEERAYPERTSDPSVEAQSEEISTGNLPKGMAERIETVEVSTLKPDK